MLNVVDLINYLRAYPKYPVFVIDQLWIDFYNNIADKNGIILGYPHLFVQSVNKTMKHMDEIYNSVPNADCKYIWASLFNKIRNVALTYYVFIVEPKFLNLEFRYTKEKIFVAESNNEALTFMGLNDRFNKEDLLKRYRMLVLKYHPDKGGRVEDFRKLQVYKEQLERKFTA